MASYNEKASPSAADAVTTAAIVLLAAASAILIGVYFARKGGFVDINSAESESSVISEATVITPAETSQTAATTTEGTTASEPTETETVSSAETAVTVEASTEYSNEFYGRALMVGDSLSVGLVNYGYLKPENVFAQIGLTPASVLTAEIGGETVYTKAAALNPDHICIMLGTNGLSYLSEDFMAQKMGEFIDGLQQTCPDAVIVLISIPPVTAVHESEKPEKIENITKYNDHIAKLAEEKSVIFVDTFSLLQDSSGYLAADYAENDGLHFKTQAYPVILSAVQTAAVGENYVPPATETTTANTAATVTSVSAVKPKQTSVTASAHTESRTVTTVPPTPETDELSELTGLPEDIEIIEEIIDN